MEKPAGNLSDFCRLSPGSGIVCADISLVANKLASQNIKEKMYPKLSAQEQVGFVRMCLYVIILNVILTRLYFR